MKYLGLIPVVYNHVYCNNVDGNSLKNDMGAEQ